MGRGKVRKKVKVKKVVKKVKDPTEHVKRKPWLWGEPQFLVSRFMWDAAKPNWTYAVEELVHPVSHVVLNYHSRIAPCLREVECRFIIRNTQRYQCQLLRYQDLAYNWYIGGDGLAYEGRGWKKHPKQQHELSTECLEIALMGDYPLTYEPPPHMIEVFHKLVDYGIEKKYIKKNYELHEFRLPPQPLKHTLR